MPVPHIFGTQTSPVAANKLDENFAAIDSFDPSLNYAAFTIGWDIKLGAVKPEWFTTDGIIISGVTDAAPAIRAAIAWCGFRNPHGVTTTGYGTGTILFDAKVYLCKSTITFLPFINYIGVRGTTADTSADFTALSQSRCTIIRAHTDIYNLTPGGGGVHIYVPVGDVTIRGITFVGTAAITGNPSIGIQWGSQGGSATTGRPHETDGSGQNCSGIKIDDCSFYTYSTAWENNALNDCYGMNVRFESNTTNISNDGNRNVSIDTSFELTGCVQFGHTNGIVYQNLPAGRTMTHHHKFIGGDILSSAAGNNSVIYLGSSPPNIDLELIGLRSSISGSGTPRHFWWGGTFTGAAINVRWNDCTLIGGTVTIARTGGAVNPTGWEFNNVRALNVAFVTNIATGGRFSGTFDNSTINATTHDNGTVNATFRNTAGVSIALTDAGCPDWKIEPKFENCAATPITIFNNAINATTMIMNPMGWAGTPAAGKIINYSGTLFANLGTPSNGSIVYCSDGTIANPVAGGGTGCIAKRLNGAWVGN